MSDEDKRLRRLRKKFNNNNYARGKRVVGTHCHSFENLKRAAEVLNEKVEKKPQSYCEAKRKKDLYSHHHITHYCSLMKRAALANDWRPIGELLIRFVEEEKTKNIYRTLIMKYAFLCFLNDPVAVENDCMSKFLQSVLNCDSEERAELLLNKLMTKYNIESEL